MKVAKLVYVNLLVRVVVEENATELQILDKAYPKLMEQLSNDLSENVEKIVDDLECPYIEPTNMVKNVMIAEFFGFQKTDLGWFDAEDVLSVGDNTFDELLFDKDYNWLLSVGGRCVDLADEVMADEWSQSLRHIGGEFSKDDLYKEIVDFVEWCKKEEVKYL